MSALSSGPTVLNRNTKVYLKQHHLCFISLSVVSVALYVCLTICNVKNKALKQRICCFECIKILFKILMEFEHLMCWTLLMLLCQHQREQQSSGPAIKAQTNPFVVSQTANAKISNRNPDGLGTHWLSLLHQVFFFNFNYDSLPST